MIIGAHLSIGKGYPTAARQAARLQLDGFQYFTRNPRGSSVRALPEAEVKQFRQLVQEMGLVNLAHLPYTVNLGSTEPRKQEFAIMVVKHDMERASALGTPFVVAHPGHFGDDGVEAGLRQVATTLQAALDGLSTDTVFCLEVMAGQSREIGGRLEELAEIIRLVDDKVEIGVGLDSAHLFAAGWDIRTSAGIDKLVAAIDAAFGWDRVKVMHLNDSKMPLGSRRDRHALIGQGEIGLEGIKAMVNHPYLSQLPMYLETPVDDYKQYQQEANLVRELIVN
ncbi:MAG: deoxyribonuclease IV [bacterium]|jgi:deoxyribonuclease-4